MTADLKILLSVQTGYTETTPPHTLDCSWLHHSVVISEMRKNVVDDVVRHASFPSAGETVSL